MNKPKTDCFTGLEIAENLIDYNPHYDGFEYSLKPIGKVRITAHLFGDISDEKYSRERYYLAGICRYYSDKSETPPMMSTGNFEKIIEEHDIPKTIDERKERILQLIRLKEEEVQDIQLFFGRDFPLVYSHENEFKRVLKKLYTEGLIDADISKDGYFGISITRKGRDFLDKLKKEQIKLDGVLSESEINKIKQLVRKAQIEEALVTLISILEKKGLSEELEMVEEIYFAHNVLIKKSLENLINGEDESVRLSEIRMRILRIL